MHATNHYCVIHSNAVQAKRRLIHFDYLFTLFDSARQFVWPRLMTFIVSRGYMFMFVPARELCVCVHQLCVFVYVCVCVCVCVLC